MVNIAGSTNDLIHEKNKKPLFSYNIMLIGFMGTGKTTVSRCLSQLLESDEVDTDQLIIEKEGISIPDIFKNHGEDYFRNCETNTLIDLESKNQLIVSCGGGIVLKEENVVHMKNNGKVVLLTASPKTILDRVKNSTDRPILNNNMNEEFIEELMEKRRNKYMKAADVIVNTDNKEVLEVAKEIIHKLKELY